VTDWISAAIRGPRASCLQSASSSRVTPHAKAALLQHWTFGKCHSALFKDSTEDASHMGNRATGLGKHTLALLPHFSPHCSVVSSGVPAGLSLL